MGFCVGLVFFRIDIALIDFIIIHAHYNTMSKGVKKKSCYSKKTHYPSSKTDVFLCS